MSGRVQILTGDCRAVLPTLPSESVQCVVTSPPYFGLRDYGTSSWEGGDPACEHVLVDTVRTPWANEVPGPNSRVKNTLAGHHRPKEIGGRCERCNARRVDRQIGLEATPSAFVAEMVAVFREVRRVLRADGTLWLNLGDSYAGSWGAQGRQGATGQMASRSVSAIRERSKISATQIAAHPQRAERTGSIRETGLKPKDLIGIPWRVALALQEDGWWLRQDIIWHKPNPMPESITDRCTKAHEYLFLLTKSERYHFDAQAIREPSSNNTHARRPGNKSHKGLAAYEGGAIEHRTKVGLVAYAQRKSAEAGQGVKNNASFDEAMAVMPEFRNKRSVWTVGSEAFSEAHFATFPPDLIVDCIRAGCPVGGTVLDPFGGAGTTGLVAQRLGRGALLIELNPDYAAMAERRIAADRAGPVERGRILHEHRPVEPTPLFGSAPLVAEPTP